MYLFRQSGHLTWHVRWWSDGRRHEVSTGCTDRVAAERIMLAMRQAVGRKAAKAKTQALIMAVYEEALEHSPALAEVEAEWIAHAPATRYTKLCTAHWRAFAAWAVRRPGIATLADIDPATCRAYVDALTGSPKTVANSYQDCARVYRTVAPLHGISTDPWRGVRLSHAATKEARGVTPEELDALLKASTGEYHGAILVGAYTGLRYHDVAVLAWTSVQDGWLRLAPAKTERHGKKVEIPLHPTLRAYLDALPRTGPQVFPGLADAYVNRPRWTARLFAKVREDANVSSQVTFHSLRHHFVSALAEAGVPEDVRRALAGHSNAAIHDRYTHLVAAKEAAVAKLR